MQVVYFINERLCISGVSKECSIEIQKSALREFMDRNGLNAVRLNPSQLNDYYTIPHALFYDLRDEKIQLDCLLMYSKDSMKDFSETYPARWILLKSYFEMILPLF